MLNKVDTLVEKVSHDKFGFACTILRMTSSYYDSSLLVALCFTAYNTIEMFKVLNLEIRILQVDKKQRSSQK